MILKKIKIQNFRNLAQQEIEFSPTLTILKGENAQGKTNFLESIFVTALIKSFRPGNSLEMIKWGENFLRIEAEFDLKDGKKKNAQIYLEASPQKRSQYKLDQVVLKIRDYIGEIKVVSFIPDDLAMLFGPPAIRRKYLNMLIFKLDREYLHEMLEYNQILKNRNAVLNLIFKNKAQKSELFFWNEKIAELGFKIAQKRLETIELINHCFGENLKFLDLEDKEVKIAYLPSLMAENKERYLQALTKNLQKDLAMGSTSSGPHRDDFAFLKNNQNIATFASRGEARSNVLALKLCEVKLIEEICALKPLLLLDDVFSELDKGRQQNLLTVIKEHQSVVTTTDDKDYLPQENSLIYAVKDGLLT